MLKSIDATKQKPCQAQNASGTGTGDAVMAIYRHFAKQQATQK
jgi:hypothetical protein